MTQHTINDNIQEYWEKRYQEWLKHPNWDIYRAKDEWFETRLSHLLPPQRTPQGKVLDYGCGNAMFAVPLLRRYAEYEGFDTSPTAVDIARRYYSEHRLDLFKRMYVHCFEGRVGQYPPRVHGGFDLIMSITVLQHQPIMYRKMMIENIKDMLSPTGLYLGLEWIGDTQAYDMPRMDEKEWRAAWAPWEITFDRHPDHPEWWADNVWTARLP